MSDPHTPEAAAIAENWGEAFVRLLDDPRIRFDDDAIVVALWKPIAVGGAEAGELRIHEPTLDQLQQLDRATGEMAKTRRLLMQVASLSEKEAGALGLRDITRVARILEAFTEAARATGA